MQLATKHFGLIEIEESRVIFFKEGLPGFEEVHRFSIIDNGASPFKWLQCLEKGDLAFAIVDPFEIKRDYEIDIQEELLDLLEIEKEEDMLIQAIVVVPEDITKISMNLKAPLVINLKKNKGMQVVLDTDQYGVRHYISEELRRWEVARNAGTDKEKRPIDSNK